MDPYNTADRFKRTRDTRSEYDANRELARARTIGRPLRVASRNKGLGVVTRGVVGVLLWGLILLAVTGASAILMGY